MVHTHQHFTVDDGKHPVYWLIPVWDLMAVPAGLLAWNSPVGCVWSHDFSEKASRPRKKKLKEQTVIRSPHPESPDVKPRKHLRQKNIIKDIAQKGIKKGLVQAQVMLRKHVLLISALIDWCLHSTGCCYSKKGVWSNTVFISRKLFRGWNWVEIVVKKKTGLPILKL